MRGDTCPNLSQTDGAGRATFPSVHPGVMVCRCTKPSWARSHGSGRAVSSHRCGWRAYAEGWETDRNPFYTQYLNQLSSAAFKLPIKSTNEVDLRIFHRGGGKFRLRLHNGTSGEIGDRQNQFYGGLTKFE